MYQTGATYAPLAPLTVQSYFTSETQNQEENLFHDSDEGAGNSTDEDNFFDDYHGSTVPVLDVGADILAPHVHFNIAAPR